MSWKKSIGTVSARPLLTPAAFLLALAAVLAAGCEPLPQGSGPSDMGLREVFLLLSPTEEPRDFQPGEDGRLSLREYYQQKYPAHERDVVRRGARRILDNYGPAELDHAIAEVLAFHHVVYGRTERHHLDRNHAVARRFEERLRQLCELHEVPFDPVMGIVSWENSGDLNKVSGAGAAGLGQMTWGAVWEAHRYAARRARVLRAEARRLREQGERWKEPHRVAQARALAARADRLDLAGRHHRMAQAQRVEDERMLAECNLEDTVLFYAFLLERYGGRKDLAVAAYHSGVQNADDILYDYLERQGEWIPRPTPESRRPFLEALERRDVHYLDLWKDRRSREMLNGLRTVYGDPVTPATAHLALGDESDLYLWKVLGSYAAYRAGPEWTARAIERYTGRNWAAIEVRGLPDHSDRAAFQASARQGHLVRLRLPVTDLGVTGGAPVPSPEAHYSWYVTPELEGYLYGLTSRLRQAAGDPELRLPVRSLSRAHVLRGSPGLPADPEERVHLKGVAADLVPGALNPRAGRHLRGLLREDFLMDRIYLRWEGPIAHVCLNPRRGDEFLFSRARLLHPGSAEL